MDDVEHWLQAIAHPLAQDSTCPWFIAKQVEGVKWFGIRTVSFEAHKSSWLLWISLDWTDFTLERRSKKMNDDGNWTVVKQVGRTMLSSWTWTRNWGWALSIGCHQYAFSKCAFIHKKLEISIILPDRGDLLPIAVNRTVPPAVATMPIGLEWFLSIYCPANGCFSWARSEHKLWDYCRWIWVVNWVNAPDEMQRNDARYWLFSTYRSFKLSRLPRLSGIFPDSWLLTKVLLVMIFLENGQRIRLVKQL